MTQKELQTLMDKYFDEICTAIEERVSISHFSMNATEGAESELEINVESFPQGTLPDILYVRDPNDLRARPLSIPVTFRLSEEV